MQRSEPRAAYARLGARVAALRAAGRSMAAVAGCLNREGFPPPKRAERFTAAMVAGFLAHGGRRGPRPRALSAAGMLREGEWLRSDLARELGMPTATLQRWRKVGWVQARKLAVPGGHWAIRAPASERKRLTRLRQYQRKRRDQPIPAELTAPKARNRR